MTVIDDCCNLGSPFSSCFFISHPPDSQTFWSFYCPTSQTFLLLELDYLLAKTLQFSIFFLVTERIVIFLIL